MNIATELEKLTSLKDRGDLSLDEFTKAKESLLFGDSTMPAYDDEANALPPPRKSKVAEPKLYLLIAVLSTIAAALSGGSVIINPRPLGIIAFAGFAIAAFLNWGSFGGSLYRRTKPER